MPPLLLAAVMLLWGWWTGLLWLALPMAIVTEILPMTARRWPLTDRHFDRIIDISNVLIVIIGAWLVFTNGVQGLLTIMTWLPVFLLPLFIAQRLCTAGRIDLSSLFLVMRRQRHLPGFAPRPVELSWPYLALILLSASVAGESMQGRNGPWFYPALFAVTAWAILAIRSHHYRLPLRLTMLLLAGALGFGIHTGLHRLHKQIEENFPEWLAWQLTPATDISQARTAIGQLGRLKFSNRILWQARTEGKQPIPPLLRRAVYQRYVYGSWQSDHDSLSPITAGDQHGEWRLHPATPSAEQLILSGHIEDGVLPLPPGTQVIQRLEADSVKRSGLGAVVVEGGPGYAELDIRHQRQRDDLLQPEDIDLDVPNNLQATLQQFLSDMGAENSSAMEILQNMQALFEREFRYSLFQREQATDTPPLQTFLQQTKQGHCEYFASATVLLLRAAGIPARYVSGYAVQEYSDLSGSYLIRQRHAHAWALAYVDGQWQDVDFTPSTWAVAEAENTPWWSILTDLWTLLRHWLQSGARDDGNPQTRYLWLALPLLILPGWWLAKRIRRRRQTDEPADAGLDLPRYGNDSEFNRVLTHLQDMGHAPAAGETLQQWLLRLADEIPQDMEQLERALAIHNRYRFCPEGISEQQRVELARLTEACLFSFTKREG